MPGTAFAHLQVNRAGSIIVKVVVWIVTAMSPATFPWQALCFN
jgi:hypothetical protein